MITEFFLFCSGANRTVLRECPSEETKYAGIGATIFFTAVLAGLSGGYALYTGLSLQRDGLLIRGTMGSDNF